MAAQFVVGDCFKAGLFNSLPKDYQFDFVSCQFALHYSFETEQKARSLLENISSRLKPGGTFVGTIPNSSWLV
jgi:mRNA (guanine-N7-)-methyltransferase